MRSRGGTWQHNSSVCDLSGCDDGSKLDWFPSTPIPTHTNPNPPMRGERKPRNTRTDAWRLQLMADFPRNAQSNRRSDCPFLPSSADSTFYSTSRRAPCQPCPIVVLPRITRWIPRQEKGPEKKRPTRTTIEWRQVSIALSLSHVPEGSMLR